MKVINEALLAEFRQPGRCEWCGRNCPQGRDPAHIFSRGAGRVDIRENLCSLCRWCHSTSGNANDGNGARPNRLDLLLIAAERERTTPEEIETKVMRFRRDDRCKVWRIDGRHSTGGDDANGQF